MRAVILLLLLLCVWSVFVVAEVRWVDDEVKSLPGIGTPKTRTLSGLLLANATYGAHLYYLFIESQGTAATDPVVLWLQGGPGSTSMFGCFCELGPYMISSTETFVDNPYSWNAHANLLFIDQPVGTGYSYVEKHQGYIRTEEELSYDLYTALLNFMAIHPEYSQQPFYVFGESYAGKYIPWISHVILQHNPREINLMGIGLGNGWVDGRYQASSYGPFLFHNNRVSQKQVQQLNFTYHNAFLPLLDAGEYRKAYQVDNNMVNSICKEAIPPVKDYFDIRYTSDPTAPLYGSMMRYMRQAEVKAALHMKGREFSGGGTAYHDLDNDEEQSALFLFPEILQNIRVLLYNGEYDLLCNWFGTSYYAANIKWPGSSLFNSAQNTTLTVGGRAAGFYKSASNLIQLVLYDAGHMSPFDQQMAAQEMFHIFIHNGF